MEPVLRHILASLDRFPEPVLVTAVPSGRAVLANAPLRRLIGPPPYTSLPLRHPDGSPCPPERWPPSRALSTGEAVVGDDLELEVAPGEWRAVAFTCLPLPDAEGRIVAVACALRDVTTQRIEHRVHAARVAVAEALGAGSDAAESAPRVLQALAEGLGWMGAVLLEAESASDCAEHLVVRALAAGPRADGAAAVARVLAEGLARSAWVNGRAEWGPVPGGDAPPDMSHALSVPLWVAGRVASVLVLLGPGPRAPHPTTVTFAQYVGADLANRLRRQWAERELERSNAWLRALFESAPVPFVVTDTRGAILEWSRAAEELYGWSREEMLGRLNDEVPVVPPEDRDDVRDLRARVLAQGRGVRDVPVRRRRRDGKRLEISLSMAPIVGPGRQVEGTVVVAFDVTQRTRFLEIAAHELRNPMASVRTIASYVREAAAAGRPLADIAPLLAVVESEVDRLSALLNEVLEGFRVGAGDLRAEHLPVDLGRVVEAALRPFAAAAGGLRFHLTLRPVGPVLVLGDARRLEDVVRNLLANARKYSPQTADVDIEVAIVGARARVSVLDRGIGIPPAEAARIFEPFYRASNLGATDPGGLGLGLYLCASIVQAHGGRIWAESRPGGGAAFRFELPLLG
jgi:PAS domain S-box-containing protein